MKRLIISGIPCLPKAWEKLFPVEKNLEQKIISFIDVFARNYYKNKKISDLVPFVSDVILEFNPDQIILHDMGVTLGILALVRARKSNDFVCPKIVIFSGAFGGFDVRKSTHPIRIQSMSYADFEQEVVKQGGEIDPKYKEHYAGIQELYRQITEVSNKQIAEKEEQKNPPKVELGGAVLIIASRNDPYIHFECQKMLQETIKNSSLKIMDYGHFPYSGNVKLLKSEVDKFQGESFDKTIKLPSKL